MRGYVFEVQDRPVFPEPIKADDYWGTIGFEAEYFDDVGDEEARERIDTFLKDMSSYCETGYEDGVGYFILHEDSKVQYFRSAYILFQNLSKRLTLRAFSEISQEVKRICRVLDDDYGDAIVYGSTFFTLDYFLRDAEVGVKYFVGPNVVEMG